MGHIAEPEGVDFIIESPPLTDKERVELSRFIKKKKLDNKSKSRRVRKVRKSKKPNTQQ